MFPLSSGEGVRGRGETQKTVKRGNFPHNQKTLPLLGGFLERVINSLRE